MKRKEGGAGGSTEVRSRDAARYCPRQRLLRVDSFHRAQRGAAVAERGGHHARAYPHHRAAAWVSSRCVRAFAAAAAARRPSGCWPSTFPIRSAPRSCAASRAVCSRPDICRLSWTRRRSASSLTARLHMILERRADGVMVIASWVFEETNLLADIKKNNVPIVIIGPRPGGARHRFDPGGQRSGRGYGGAPPEGTGASPHRRDSRTAGDVSTASRAGRESRSVAAEEGIEIDPRLVFQLPGLADPASGFEGGLGIAKKDACDRAARLRR